MKVALIGATGAAGSRILAEALRRGHAVTALVRHPGKLTAQPNLSVRAADVNDEKTLIQGLKGQEALLCSFTPMRGSPDYLQACLAGYRTILNAAKAAGVKRLLIVGGAGSLKAPNGMDLVDTPHFPAEYKTEASAFRDVLNLVRRQNDLDWTYVSPSAFFAPGQRTGHYRIGADQLLTDAEGQSRISMEDFAIAMLDELEHPKHLRKRFTVGY